AGTRHQPQRTRRRPARHHHDPSGDQGIGRAAGGNRGDVMTTVFSAPPVSYETAIHQLRDTAPGISLRPHAQTPEQVREAAVEFEALFLSEMMGHMFEGVDVDPLFGGGSGERMFRDMLTQEYGKVLARSGNGIGLAD